MGVIDCTGGANVLNEYIVRMWGLSKIHIMTKRFRYFNSLTKPLVHGFSTRGNSTPPGGVRYDFRGGGVL